jgi:hypothetical protein
VPENAVDCGPATRVYCQAGNVCTKEGNCISQEEADRRAEAERERRREEVAERKRREEERREAARRKEEDRKEAAKREQERRNEIERKKKEEIAQRQREAEEKKERERKLAAEAAKRQAELRESRRGITSASAPRGTQAGSNWTPDRIRAARPLPLPIIDSGRIIRRPMPGLLPPTIIVRPQDIPQEAKTLPAELVQPPLKWAGKLYFRGSNGDAHCSAQFISRNVILTAAHCVQDRETKAYHTGFAFALQYHRGASSQVYGWKCVAAPEAWAARDGQEAFYWDYAMLLASDDTKTGYFGAQHGWDSAHDSAAKIGYPREVAAGEQMQVVRGPISLARLSSGVAQVSQRTETAQAGLVEMRHGNPNSGKGSSGGAWVAKFSTTSGEDANIIVSVTSFITNAPGVVYGPYLSSEFKRLFEYVSSGCPK